MVLPNRKYVKKVQMEKKKKAKKKEKGYFEGPFQTFQPNLYFNIVHVFVLLIKQA